MRIYKTEEEVVEEILELLDLDKEWVNCEIKVNFVDKTKFKTNIINE